MNALCERHGVARLYAFGSSVTDRFNTATSDVDLLVEVPEPDPLRRGETLIALWEDLETLLGRRVDLLTPESIRNPYLKKSVEQSRLLLYDRQRQSLDDSIVWAILQNHLPVLKAEVEALLNS